MENEFSRDSYYYFKKNGCKTLKKRFNCNISLHTVLSTFSSYEEFGLFLNCLLPLFIGPCILPICVALLCFFNLVEEIAQISVHRLDHFKSKENCLDITIIGLTVLLFTLIATG